MSKQDISRAVVEEGLPQLMKVDSFSSGAPWPSMKFNPGTGGGVRGYNGSYTLRSNRVLAEDNEKYTALLAIETAAYRLAGEWQSANLTETGSRPNLDRYPERVALLKTTTDLLDLHADINVHVCIGENGPFWTNDKGNPLSFVPAEFKTIRATFRITRMGNFEIESMDDLSPAEKLAIHGDENYETAQAIPPVLSTTTAPPSSTPLVQSPAKTQEELDAEAEALANATKEKDKK